MREIKFRIWNGKDGFCTDSHVKSNLFNYLKYYPEHVQQFTGLKDMNRKEIYEGDIVKFSVQGDLQENPMVISIPEIFVELGHDDNYYLPDNDSFEVIGNIYENPELIKEHE